MKVCCRSAILIICQVMSVCGGFRDMYLSGGGWGALLLRYRMEFVVMLGWFVCLFGFAGLFEIQPLISIYFYFYFYFFFFFATNLRTTSINFSQVVLDLNALNVAPPPFCYLYTYILFQCIPLSTICMHPYPS